MNTPSDRKVVLVTRRTRLEELLLRFHTLAQARFYIEHLGADFADYQKEHETYHAARKVTVQTLEAHGRYQIIDRAFLPNFIFSASDVVVTLGQDGLVANTIKYLDGLPLIGLNPDTYRYDGILLPFEARDLPQVLRDTLAGSRQYKLVTMAKATLSDQQIIYAVNDLFIGPRSHTSARYQIQLGTRSEIQSSSGVIVSTGVGSTGWMKSVITGSFGVAASLQHKENQFTYPPMAWDAKKLCFAVREPFPSKSSGARLVFGEVTARSALHISSLMPENGVIFSDGIEADYLEFNSGAHATIGIAEREGCLVI